MKRSLVLRASMALGVVLFVAGPLTAASAATAAKKHPHKVKHVSGTKLAVSGDLVKTASDGGVGFAFHGAGWFANDEIDLEASGLNAVCGGTAEFAGVNLVPAGSDFSSPGATILADGSGVFNVAFDALFCPSGTYQVTAQEVFTPNQEATVAVTITNSVTQKASVILSPTTEVESGVTGEIAGTAILAGLLPKETYNFSSNGLDAACAQPDGAFAQAQDSSGFAGGLVLYNSVTGIHALQDDNGGPFFGLTGTTDTFGDDIVEYGLDGCVNGTYPVNVDENGGGHRVWDPMFTVQAP